MSRSMMLAFMVVVMVGMVGCKKKPRQDIAEVPPPSGSQTSSAQSIYVGPPALTNSADIYVPPAPTTDTYSSTDSMTSIYATPTTSTGTTSLYTPPATPVAPPAPAPAPAATSSLPTYTIPVPNAGGSSYTVQRGDTLWSIAVRVYGDGKRWQSIATANNIGNERKLAVGQKLIIP